MLHFAWQIIERYRIDTVLIEVEDSVLIDPSQFSSKLRVNMTDTQSVHIQEDS